MVKRVNRDIASQTIVFYSANPAYEPRRFSGPELDEIRIAGKVVTCYHKMGEGVSRDARESPIRDRKISGEAAESQKNFYQIPV
ncbi:MAG: hypothetical protein LBK66_12560 [Spirochaetaceae bacterium]|nr:hypothetical protein [Spirochaetaceae bacterium]